MRTISRSFTATSAAAALSMWNLADLTVRSTMPAPSIPGTVSAVRQPLPVPACPEPHLVMTATKMRTTAWTI